MLHLRNRMPNLSCSFLLATLARMPSKYAKTNNKISTLPSPPHLYSSTPRRRQLTPLPFLVLLLLLLSIFTNPILSTTA